LTQTEATTGENAENTAENQHSAPTPEV
jgi:hypothetical protein